MSNKQKFLEQYQMVLTESTANALGIEVMNVDEYWKDEQQEGDA